jgi:threonine dehydrogenase-like Zn-dependent dehydrogenase
MGLLLGQVMSRLGCGEIAVVEPNPSRRLLAQELGFGYAFDPAEDVMEPTRNTGYDVVVDATGVLEVIERGLTYVARGGKFLVFGVAPVSARATFSPFDLYNRDISILGSMAVNMTLPYAWLHIFGSRT